MAAMNHKALALVFLACVACNKKATPSAERTSPASSVAATGAAGELLAVGATAPDIEATAHNGQKVKLSEFRGKPVVVYFYPKDDTPGCTAEAEGIRDEWEGLGQTNTVVLGVSSDDNDSHKAFAEKYKLPFMLLPDPDGKIAQAFGVPMRSGHAKRVTFVIDKSGKVAKVFPDVEPKGHAAELISTVRGLSS
jgi:peroxiredoxin Q/BCP